VAVPGPLPVVVDAIHGALAAAIQLQPGAVSTVIDPLSPAAAALIESGDTV
jgi:S1-C subfamily serine protease